MSQAFAGKQFYLTLENGDQLHALHTSGDTIRGKVHLRPFGNESLSVTNLRVNFKCKARTLITVHSNNASSHRTSTTHKSSVYLFWFSAEVVSRSITVNSHHSWDVEFQFPWTAMPHPTQISFGANPAFPHQVGHRLPPTWSRDCHGHTQSVEYYLEAIMNRQGRMIDHKNKDRIPLFFCPPLDIPDPAPFRQMGRAGYIMRTSRLLDPVKKAERYGFRERTKRIFSSNQDPSARFVVKASAPTVCCVGDVLPINLHVTYNQNSSTAPEQPEISINNFYVRLNDYVQYRVPITRFFGDSELCKDSDNKINVAGKIVSVLAKKIVYDGMSLNEITPLRLSPALGPSFATFSISRNYVLKVSAVFNCAGKNYDLVLLRHLLTVHPARTLYRPLPGASPSLMQPLEAPVYGDEDGDETLPPYKRD